MVFAKFNLVLDFALFCLFFPSHAMPSTVLVMSSRYAISIYIHSTFQEVSTVV